MSKIRGPRKLKKPLPARLFVRLDAKSKKYLKQAAALRHICVSEYVRIVAIPQARREVLGARNHTIVMTPDEQLEFWNALHDTSPLTRAQRRLGALMRGEV